MQHRQRVCEIRAPAKLILCGQHAVVYGQDAVAMSIGLHCNAEVSRRERTDRPSTIVFELQIEQDAIEIDSELIGELSRLGQVRESGLSYQQFQQKLEGRYAGRSRSFKSLHYKLGLFLGKSGIGWDTWSKQGNMAWIVSITSKIPLGKGLGSSAAFNTVLSTALLLIFGKVSIKQIKQLSFQLKQQINRLAYEFQCVEHGNPSGIDNFVSVHGGLIVFNRSKQPRFKLLKGAAEKLKAIVELAIADSHIQKNTKLAVGRVRQLCTSSQLYVQKIKQIGRISERIIEMLIGQAELSTGELLTLVARNHGLLAEFGLSHPEIQKLVEVGKANGWVGKITGSGMGGCIILVGARGQTTLQPQLMLTPLDHEGLTISVANEE